MMETEYGVGIKNRFAFLGSDVDDNGPEVVTIKLNKSSSNSGSGKKPSVPKSVGACKSANIKTTASVAVGSSLGGQKDTVPKGRKQSAAVQEEKNTRDNSGGGFVAEKGPRQGRQGQGSTTRGFRRDRDGPSNKWSNNKSRFAEDKDKESKKDAESTGENAVVDSGKDVMREETMELPEGDVERIDDAQEDENKDEEKTLTLAEWKALQAPREKPVFNIRKPGEGEVSSKLEKLVLKKREDDIGNQEDEEYEPDDVYYPQRAGKMKLIKDVGFNTGYQKRRGGRFSTSARSGGGDGSNGREPNPTAPEQTNVVDKPRGRPRFGFRGGHQRPVQVPRIDDASDFPTLG